MKNDTANEIPKHLTIRTPPTRQAAWVDGTRKITNTLTCSNGYPQRQVHSSFSASDEVALSLVKMKEIGGATTPSNPPRGLLSAQFNRVPRGRPWENVGSLRKLELKEKPEVDLWRMLTFVAENMKPPV
jgi:hypothetical protein